MKVLEWCLFIFSWIDLAKCFKGLLTSYDMAGAFSKRVGNFIGLRTGCPKNHETPCFLKKFKCSVHVTGQTQILDEREFPKPN